MLPFSLVLSINFHYLFFLNIFTTGYMCDCQMANSTALLLCGVLSINLIVVTLLICFINAGNCCSGKETFTL